MFLPFTHKYSTPARRNPSPTEFYITIDETAPKSLAFVQELQDCNFVFSCERESEGVYYVTGVMSQIEEIYNRYPECTTKMEPAS